MSVTRNRYNAEFWRTSKRNNRSFNRYYFRLCEIATNIFEWVNLPEEIDERFLELCLYTDGNVLFFKDDVTDRYVVTRSANTGKLDIYNIPTERHAYASNGFHDNKNSENSVIIFNNTTRTNSMDDVIVTADQLFEIEQTMGVNVKVSKTPMIIKSSKQQQMTMQNLLQKYDGNVPFIFGSDDLNTNDSIQVLNTNAPYICDRLHELKTNIWNDCLTYLGVPNVSITKKERMVTDEVNRSMGGTIACRYSRLNARKQACKHINKMFDLDIDVRYRTDDADGFNESERSVEE